MPEVLPLAIQIRLMDVLRFLDMKGLAFFEQTSFIDNRIRSVLWEEAASLLLEKTALWGPSACSMLEQLKNQGFPWKQWVHELKMLRRLVLPPKTWQPWISSQSFCSLKFIPQTWDASDIQSMQLRSSQGAPAVVDDITSYPSLRVPSQAAVAVSVGVFHGQPLLVSMRIETEGTAGDDICLGIELCGDTKAMSLMLAPCSGHCFIKHAGSGPLMRADVFESVDSPVSIQVWIQVFETGAIRFLRQAKGKDLEDSGLLAAECFPKWITTYFACVYCWGHSLQSPTTVSVDDAGDTFPSWLAGKAPTEMDVIWHLLEADE
eukprot:TRINITY_DN19434_c0_g1_i2.p1 TRINITY_DN19434_c0_g1~~TRINITY_DN19434_c0_g1_i2.p1  ORF type:complete len:344 (-),score=55.62 TRINITY_DN19434_c0_g1_i2:379-1335(-)